MDEWAGAGHWRRCCFVRSRCCGWLGGMEGCDGRDDLFNAVLGQSLQKSEMFLRDLL